MYTVAQIKSDLTPKLHDTTLDKLSGDFFDKCGEAARKVRNRIDPYETIRTVSLGDLVDDDVPFIFEAPIDLKGKKVISIIPTDTDVAVAPYNQITPVSFRFNKRYGDFSVMSRNGSKFIYFTNYNNANDTTGYTVEYYSNYLFQNEAGDYIEKPTSLEDDDVIVLEGEAYEAFLWELAEICAHEVQAENSSYDITYARQEKEIAYRNYTGDNKSLAARPQTSYYRKNRRGRYWNNDQQFI